MSSLSQAIHPALENPLRQQLAARWQRGQKYAFLDGAFRYLAECDADPQIVLLAVRGLCELGLGGPARELLDQRGDLAGDDANLQALRRSVSALPSGRVPWERRREIFDRNVRAMCAAHPASEMCIELINASKRDHQLFETNDGRLHLSIKSPGELRRWIPALTDFPEMRDLAMPESETHRPILVLGVAGNDLIRRAYAASTGRKSHGTVPIFIVEPDPARVATWLHASDQSEILADPRMHIFTGESAPDDFALLLRERGDLELPTVRLTCYATNELLTIVDDAVREIHLNREQTYVQVTQSIARRTDLISPGEWAERLKPGAKILGITSRFTTMLQYSMRDIGHAFEELGFKFNCYIEPADHCSMSTLTVARHVHDHDPDLIVLINHLRYEQAASFGQTPVLSWIQDPMDNVLCRAAGQSIGPLDFVCGYFGQQCVEQFGYPREHYFNSVLPVSTRTFHDGPVDPADAAEIECDIMYVGHFHADEREHIALWKQACPSHLHPLLDALAHKVKQIISAGEHIVAPAELVRTTCVESSLALEPETIEKIAHMFVFRFFDILFRRQTLHWVAAWAARTGRRFRLYGNGWSRDPILAPFAVGPIAHGEPLRRAYRAARFVLQTVPSSFLHQRSFETLASGSLVLGRCTPASFGGLSRAEFLQRRREDLPIRSCAATWFPMLDAVTFDDAEQFEHLISQMLDSPQLAEDLRQGMRRIVIENLSYRAVLSGVIDFVRDGLRRATAKPHETTT